MTRIILATLGGICIGIGSVADAKNKRRLEVAMLIATIVVGTIWIILTKLKIL